MMTMRALEGSVGSLIGQAFTRELVGS
jgi:hypothetical protein